MVTEADGGGGDAADGDKAGFMIRDGLRGTEGFTSAFEAGEVAEAEGGEPAADMFARFVDCASE